MLFNTGNCCQQHFEIEAISNLKPTQIRHKFRTLFTSLSIKKGDHLSCAFYDCSTKQIDVQFRVKTSRAAACDVAVAAIVVVRLYYCANV